MTSSPLPGPMSGVEGLALPYQVASGPVRRRLLPGSVGARELAPNAVQAGDIATSALGRCRYAAFSGRGSTGQGSYCTFNWVPAGPQGRFRFSVTLASSVAPTGTVFLFGWTSAQNNQFSFRVNVNGSVSVVRRFFMDQTVLTTPAWAGLFDGRAHRLDIQYGWLGCFVSWDGEVVGSSSFPLDVDTVLRSQGLGGVNGGTSWPGALWDMELIDEVTPANSIRLLMDEPSGNYVNTYPGSTAAASATRNGYVSTVPVLSLDGLGRPWQGAPVPLVYQARRVGALTLTGSTSYTPVMNTEDLDPTGSMANGSFTAFAPCLAVMTWTGSIQRTSVASLPDTIGASIVAGGVTVSEVQISVTAINTLYNFCVRASRALTAGQTADGRISRIDSAADTWTLEVACFTVEVYPTPTTG